jgi:HD-GYP domain-containing protein (c-di-GMP phosphodiesterase class II)
MGIHHLILLAAIALLAAALYQSWRIGEVIPKALGWRWRGMEGLICFFLLGYGAEFWFRGMLPLGPAEYLISSVYLGGSLFVLMIMRLSRLAMHQIRQDARRIADMHAELWDAYDSTIAGWGRALELRDQETEGHTQRVCAMTMALARAYPFTEEELRAIKYGALLHDIGKMAIPDSILMKDGPLTVEERAVMMRHPLFAREMLAGIAFLYSALDIPYCHHERWDGTGYPQGLRGEAIPLSARIFAVADVWDALISKRRYHEPWNKELVCTHIRAGSGSSFDPAVVEKFLALDLCAVAQDVYDLDLPPAAVPGA